MILIALILCLQAAPAQEKKEDPKKNDPWKITLAASYEFSDTLVMDPFNQPLGSEIVDRKDSALIHEANLSHDFFKLGPIVGELGLGFRQVSWIKHEDFDLTLVSPSLTILLVESPVVFTQMVGVKYAAVGGDPFAQNVSSISALGVAPVPVVLSYAFSATEYQVRAPSGAEDRDGVQHTLLALGTLSEKPLSVKVGFFASWVTTDGQDFDRVEWGPLAILEYDLFWKTHWKTELRWTSARYLHNNSLAPTAMHRSDGRADVETSIRKPLLDELTAVLWLDYRNYGSNIAAFDYDRLVVQLGLELKL
jgi:hypothetical protein